MRLRPYVFGRLRSCDPLVMPRMARPATTWLEVSICCLRVFFISLMLYVLCEDLKLAKLGSGRIILF